MTKVDSQRLERIGNTLSADIASGLIHGAAMRVSLHGDTIIDFCEGYADKAADKMLSANSVFATMSVAKPFTNVLALGLVERGLLRLHSPVSDVIPEFAQFGKERVNLFHLLTQTSGVMQGMPPVGPEIFASIAALTEYACGLPLECKPGERVNYSILVAHSIIATMCLRANGRGRNYATMLAEEIFHPLGMSDTSLGCREDLYSRLCPVKIAQRVPYSSQTAPDQYEASFDQMMQYPGAEVPAAGCVTTIGDLHRFAEMLRRGGDLDGVRIISPAMLAYCSQNVTGAMRNVVWDASVSARNWEEFPANLGIGFLVRGEGVRPGPFGILNSPNTFGGFGSGSTGIWIDPKHGLSFSFLSTGLLEESHHLERTALLSDLVMSALTN